ncbi:MAG: hypothetical protein PHI85_03790 [Victivallaceae bacterium]|nr:hypothetical protein [Victivallaceae bacterium]
MSGNASEHINIGTALALFGGKAVGIARTPVEITRIGRDSAFSDWNDQSPAVWVQDSGTELAVSFEIDVPSNGLLPVTDDAGKLFSPAPGTDLSAARRELKLLPTAANAGRGLRFPAVILNSAWNYVWNGTAAHRLRLRFSAFPDTDRLLMETTAETAAGLVTPPRVADWTELENALAAELNRIVPFSGAGVWCPGARFTAPNGGSVRAMSETPDFDLRESTVIFQLAVRQTGGGAATELLSRLFAALPWLNRECFRIVTAGKAVRTENGGVNVTLAAVVPR